MISVWIRVFGRFACLMSFLILPSFWALAGSAAQRQAAPDAIYYNAKVITVDARFSIASAFAVSGDKFVAVGGDREILKLATADTQRIDLGGRTVMPGFQDGHIHLLPVEPDFEAMPLHHPKTIAELLASVANQAKMVGPGKWLTFTANDWHPAALKEKRFPTRWELDTVTPNNPVYILRGGQTIVVNSLALQAARITKDTEPFEGTGVIEKDDVSGEPTGLLLSNARFMVRDVVTKLPFDNDRAVTEIVNKSRLLNAAGVTSVRDGGLTPDQIRGYQDAYARGLLTLRANLMYEPRSRQDPLEKVIEQMRAFGPVTGFGDEWLRIGGLKLHIDGAIESALLIEPYAHDPHYHGLKNYPLDKYKALLEEAARLGWSVGVHAVGDKAIDLTLDAFEEVNQKYTIEGKRWALEHAMLGTERRLDTIKRLGVVMSVQEWTFYLYSHPASQSWGMERVKRLTPIKTWLDHDVMVAGGTDRLPTAETLNIQFLMIWSALTRNTENLGVVGPSERISRRQAIWLHTHAPAYLSFEENIKGTIEPGRLADFIVLSDDILNVPIDQIKDLKVLKTFVGGKQVYQLDNLSEKEIKP